MENNRQFELMRSAARQKLEGADPVQLSVLTGLCWDGRTFDTETLGIPIRISWPAMTTLFLSTVTGMFKIRETSTKHSAV